MDIKHQLNQSERSPWCSFVFDDVLVESSFPCIDIEPVWWHNRTGMGHVQVGLVSYVSFSGAVEVFIRSLARAQLPIPNQVQLGATKLLIR